MFDLQALREACRELARTDVSTLFDDEVRAGVLGMVAIRNLVETAEAHFLAELDARGLTDAQDGMKTVPWVADRAGVAPGPTRQRLRIGRALRERLGSVDAAVVAGAVSFDHVRALVADGNPRVRNLVADMQDELLELAKGATFEAWRADVRRAVAYLDQDGPCPAAADPGTNRLSMTAELDGTFHLDRTLCAEDGQLVSSAIEQLTRELFRRGERDARQAAELQPPITRRLRADALVELCRRGLAVDLEGSKPARVAATVVVRDGHVTDEQGQPIPPSVFERWACDLDLTAMTVTAGGEPLDLGRTQQHPNRAQRRALRVRDGGCVFPGCDVPADWCEVHHVHWWSEGGPTDIGQLALLCHHHHHRVSHRPGWSMHARADQRFWWETPSGRILHSQRHRRRGDAADAAAVDDDAAA